MKEFIYVVLPGILFGMVVGVMIIYMIMHTCRWEEACF